MCVSVWFNKDYHLSGHTDGTATLSPWVQGRQGPNCNCSRPWWLTFTCGCIFAPFGKPPSLSLEYHLLREGGAGCGPELRPAGPSCRLLPPLPLSINFFLIFISLFCRRGIRMCRSSVLCLIGSQPQ